MVVAGGGERKGQRSTGIAVLARSDGGRISSKGTGKGRGMKTVSLAEAKAQLSELITRAAEGETVCITRRGKPVARLTAVEAPRKRIDTSALRALTDTLPRQSDTAGTSVQIGRAHV